MKQVTEQINGLFKDTFILDVLRGLAAVYVLIGHSRWLLWEGYSDGYLKHPENYSFIGKLLVYFYAMFGYGHQAVMVFFVLSGFVIHYSTYKQFQKIEKFSIPVYLYKRIKRIYPPFFAALILTYALDMVGRYFGYSIYSGTTQFELINKNIYSDLSLKVFLGNLLMVQTVYTPVWGTNGPLWSLMFEWWFYILYIPFFYINIKSPLLSAILAFAICLLNSFHIFYLPKLIYIVLNSFFCWYFGLMMADIYMKRIRGWHSIILLSGIVAYIVFCNLLKIQPEFFNSNLMLCIVFAIGIFVLLRVSSYLTFLIILRPISDFSYTLYIIHMPLLVFFSGWLQEKYNGALPITFIYIFLGTIFSIAFAYVLHQITERPFMKRR